MKELDIAKINETAPYKVFNTRRYHYYGFKTKADVVLLVGFEEDDLLSSESYQFTILNGSGKPSPRDILFSLQNIICFLPQSRKFPNTHVGSKSSKIDFFTCSLASHA